MASVVPLLQLPLATVVPDDPNKPYDVVGIIESVVDDRNFFSLQKGYADNLVVGLGRIGGRPVRIVANQPRVLAGTLDINASDKLARFVRFMDAFNIPLITLVDTP